METQTCDHRWRLIPEHGWATYRYYRCVTCQDVRVETCAERDARILAEMQED